MGNRQTAEDDKEGLMQACRALVLRQRVGGARARELEDVTQEACVKALEIEQPGVIREPLRYILRIARNLFIDRRRKERRAGALIVQLGTTGAASVPADPERVLAGKQELQRALAAIDDLPPRCREAFTLHRFEGLSYAAIARRMNISNGTVEKHIAEAMLRIGRACRTSENEP
jgi:RNA polymerase sigma-70 factor (ECF subfamily)